MNGTNVTFSPDIVGRRCSLPMDFFDEKSLLPSLPFDGIPLPSPDRLELNDLPFDYLVSSTNLPRTPPTSPVSPQPTED